MSEIVGTIALNIMWFSIGAIVGWFVKSVTHEN